MTEQIKYENGIDFEPGLKVGDFEVESPAEHAKNMELASEKFDLPQFQKVDATFRSFNGQDADQKRYFESRSDEEKAYLKNKYGEIKEVEQSEEIPVAVSSVKEEPRKEEDVVSVEIPKTEEKPGFLKTLDDLVHDRAVRMAREKAEEGGGVKNDVVQKSEPVVVGRRKMEEIAPVETTLENKETDIKLEGEKKINEANNFDELSEVLDLFGGKIVVEGKAQVLVEPLKDEIFKVRQKCKSKSVAVINDTLDNSHLHKRLPLGLEDKIRELLIKENSPKVEKSETEPEFKMKIESANNFDELFEAIGSFGETVPNKELGIIIVNNLKTSINKYRSGETLINVSDIIESLKNHGDGGGALKDINETYGFRKKVYELLKKERSGKFIRTDGSIVEWKKETVETPLENKPEEVVGSVVEQPVADDTKNTELLSDEENLSPSLTQDSASSDNLAEKPADISTDLNKDVYNPDDWLDGPDNSGGSFEDFLKPEAEKIPLTDLEQKEKHISEMRDEYEKFLDTREAVTNISKATWRRIDAYTEDFLREDFKNEYSDIDFDERYKEDLFDSENGIYSKLIGFYTKEGVNGWKRVIDDGHRIVGKTIDGTKVVFQEDEEGFGRLIIRRPDGTTSITKSTYKDVKERFSSGAQEVIGFLGDDFRADSDFYTKAFKENEIDFITKDYKKAKARAIAKVLEETKKSLADLKSKQGITSEVN